MTIHYWHSRKTRPKTIHSPNLNFYFRIVKEFGKFKALLWMLENFWVVLTSKCFLTNQVLWAEQNNFDFQIDNFRSINIENKCNGEKNAMMTLLMKTSDFKWERRLCGRRVPFCHLPSVLATNRFEWFSHLDLPNGTEHVNLGQISSFRTQCRNGESTNKIYFSHVNPGLVVNFICNLTIRIKCFLIWIHRMEPYTQIWG